MIADALEITIVVSMVVLVVYPATLTLLEVWRERRSRRVRAASRSPRRRRPGERRP